MEEELSETSEPRRRFRKRWIAWALLGLWAGVGVWNTTKPMPAGTNVSTAARVSAADVQFLYDLTRAPPQGELLYEQRIFDEVFRIVDEARSFIVADFFLLNEHMGAAGAAHRALSRELVEHLIARKQAVPSLSVLLLTDPINDVYGGAPSPALAELRKAGIEVVVTDLESLRDSNPLYSSIWRMLLQWWGNAPSGGGMSNPFNSDGSEITLRSWLALLNFKANHRKLVVADREDGNLVALVTSANPHDASSAHSNVALRFTGALAGDLVASEMAVARFSGWRGHIYAAAAEDEPAADAARRRTVVHHRGSDPPTLDRRCQRHAQRRQREHRYLLSGGSQSGGCAPGRGRPQRTRAHHSRSESRCVRSPEGWRTESAGRERVGHAERREDRSALVSHARRAVPHEDRAGPPRRPLRRVARLSEPHPPQPRQLQPRSERRAGGCSRFAAGDRDDGLLRPPVEQRRPAGDGVHRGVRCV